MHSRLPRHLVTVGLMLSAPVAAQTPMEGPVPVVPPPPQQGYAPVPVPAQFPQEGSAPAPAPVQFPQESPAPVFAPAGQQGSERMKLKAGTMQAGGVVSLSSHERIPLEGNGNSTTSYYLNLYPSFGYFVADRFELTANLSLQKNVGDNSSSSSTPLGIGVGLKYHIDFSAVFFYFGGNIGVDLDFPPSNAGSNAKTTGTLTLGVPVGILLPLNKWVALDIGMQVSMALPFNTNATKVLSIDTEEGFMGVQAFF